MNLSDFEHAMSCLPEIPPGATLAAGVSGGPDSMAMLWLLVAWAEKHDVLLQAYTVDHGLRAESAEEARRVGGWIKSWPRVQHHILNWVGDKPQTRILEEARAARYYLMKAAMTEAGIKHLFIAHHADDQAETFLIRLAKGSGLDGLSGMRPVQDLGDGVHILRPLLDVSKEDLIQTCKDNNVPYVDDPTNKNADYLRPRLRAAKDILEEEGLSVKRLCATSRRLARAREALDDLAQDLFTLSMTERLENGFMFDYRVLHASHEELVVRVLLHAMDEIHPDSDYGPRLEKVENLLDRILRDVNFKGATLGGCIFAINRKNETLWIGKE